MKFWQVHRGDENMRLDALLMKSPDGAFRLYDWMEPCVTLGHSQRRERDILADCPLATYSRPTGGRAVLHGHDLTIAHSVPLTTLAALTGRRTLQLERATTLVYRAMIGPLVAAMRASGADVCLGEDWTDERVNTPSADCFAHLSVNDIVDRRTGTKACGCALRITQSSALVQSSIPVRAPLIDPASIFRFPASVTPVELDKDVFAEAFEREFRRMLELASASSGSDRHNQ